MLLGGGLVILGGVMFAEWHDTVPEAALDAIPILLGVIASFIAMTNIVVLASKRTEAGIQTGMNQTFRNIGSAIGPVLASTIISSVTETVVVQRVFPPNGPPGGIAITATFPAAAAYQDAFLAVAALGAVMTLLAFFLENYRFDGAGTRVGSATPASSATPRPGEPTPAVGVTRAP
jgi:MFS family permease